MADKNFIVNESKYKELCVYKCMYDMVISLLKEGLKLGYADLEWLENAMNKIKEGEDYVQ